MSLLFNSTFSIIPSLLSGKSQFTPKRRGSSANVTNHLLASLVFSPPVRLRGWVQVLGNKISRCHTAIFPPSQLNFPPRFRNIIMQNFEILISMISFDKRSERVLCALCCPLASAFGRNELFSVISSSFEIS